MPHLCAQGAAHAARRRRSHDDLSSCAMCTPRSRRSTAAPSCCSGGCRTRRPARSPTDPPRAGSSAGDGCTGLAGEGGAHASTAGATAARRPLRGGGGAGRAGGRRPARTHERGVIACPLSNTTVHAGLAQRRSLATSIVGGCVEQPGLDPIRHRPSPRSCRQLPSQPAPLADLSLWSVLLTCGQDGRDRRVALIALLLCTARGAAAGAS
jgi:hypothetical protein